MRFLVKSSPPGLAEGVDLPWCTLALEGPEEDISIRAYFPGVGFDVFPAVLGLRASVHD